MNKMDDLREQVVNGFTSFIEQRQKEIMRDCYGIEEATVPLDKAEQAREEIDERIRACVILGGTERAKGLEEAKAILDKLIAEVEE